MRPTILVLIVSTLGLLCADSALQSASRLEVLVNRDVDFSRYGTYAWHADQVPAENRANHIRLVVAIQEGLNELGYRIDTEEPDLRIRYRFEMTEITVSDLYESAEKYRGYESSSRTEPIGVLLMELLFAFADRDEKVERLALTLLLSEADSNFIAWRVRGLYVWSPDRAERIINAAVHDLLRAHPLVEKGENR